MGVQERGGTRQPEDRAQARRRILAASTVRSDADAFVQEQAAAVTQSIFENFSQMSETEKADMMAHMDVLKSAATNIKDGDSKYSDNLGKVIQWLRSALYNWPAKIDHWPADLGRSNLYLKTRPYSALRLVLPV